LSSDLRNIVRELAPELPWLSIRRGEDTYLSDTFGLRYLALSVGGLGLLALSLASMGLYAVMAYLVMLRRREIGIRMAVGADPRRIVSMVLRNAFGLVLTGSAIGLALPIPLAFCLRAVFVGTVTPLDPVALVPTFALMMLVGLLAAAIPASRAARVDPMQTLKEN
jgi:putative ABC transport system permease protein